MPHAVVDPMPFVRLRILIVEDEYYLADDLARALTARGAEVVGPSGTIGEAEALVAAGRFDCAILDMNLRGASASRLAERLVARGTPFLVATGYNSASLPESLAEAPLVEKPFDIAQVAAAITKLLGMVSV